MLQIEFPFTLPLGYYQSCTLWSSNYADGPYSSSGRNPKSKGQWMRDLRAMALTSVPLPSQARRIVWKVEGRAGLVTFSDVFREHG